ncbi:MAG TPA: MarR family transcriptional regulator [Acidimicrobiia bacterium]|nr:MarR family transcriptional regulator [Acidimicrobiia bacterium]
MTDRLDAMLARWQTSRPDLDFSPLEVGNRVLRAAQLIQTRLDSIAAAYGLSHRGDLETLTELELVGPLSPSELAEDLLLTSGGMTVRLNRLQAAELIERQPNPRDGRGVLVHLTAAGSELVNDALTAVLDAQSAMVGTLKSSERERLAGLLRTLLYELGDKPPFVPSVAAKHRSNRR